VKQGVGQVAFCCLLEKGAFSPRFRGGAFSFHFAFEET
jgi:hypothetical protein